MTARTRKFVSEIILRSVAFMVLGVGVLAVTTAGYWAYVGLLMLRS